MEWGKDRSIEINLEAIEVIRIRDKLVWTRSLAVEVVRSDQVLNIVSRQI